MAYIFFLPSSNEVNESFHLTKQWPLCSLEICLCSEAVPIQGQNAVIFCVFVRVGVCFCAHTAFMPVCLWKGERTERLLIFL